VEAALAAAGALASAGAAGLTLAARGPRSAILGMAAALVVSPLALAPFPQALPLTFWLVASLLAAFLLLRSIGDPAERLAPLPLGGWPEAAFVIAVLVLGWAASPVAGAGRGASTALAAGLAACAAALPLVGFARDPVRTGIGTILLLEGAGLVAAGLGGTPGGAQIMALALAVLAAAAAAREVIAATAPITTATAAAIHVATPKLAPAAPDGHPTHLRPRRRPTQGDTSATAPTASTAASGKAP
jgi:hypothetical protein